MADAPKTIAEMQEAAIAAIRRVEVRADHVGGRLSYRLGATGYSNPLDAAEEAIRAIPLPADDAEMVEKVARAIYDSIGDVSGPVDLRVCARAALSAMRGEQ